MYIKNVKCLIIYLLSPNKYNRHQLQCNNLKNNNRALILGVWIQTGIITITMQKYLQSFGIDLELGNDIDFGSEHITSEEDTLIYPNARISKAISMLLILTFVLTHKLSGAAVKNLLSLIDLHCLIPNPLFQSLYKFKQFFKFLQHPLKKHHYCSRCCMALPAQSTKCQNISCQQDYAGQQLPFFTELPIIDQLKVLFTRKGFYHALWHRFSRSDQHNSIKDIYDGMRYRVYQQFMQPGKFLFTLEHRWCPSHRT